MTITVKNGKELAVTYAYAPTINGRCVVQLPGDHTFAEVANDFEGVDNFHVVDESSGAEYDYAGYTVVTYMNRNANGINIQLVKE